MGVLPMLPHGCGVLEDLATDTKGKPQARTFPQSLFRLHLNIFGCIYIIVVLRRVTLMLGPGLKVLKGFETWAAVGREFVFCQHRSGLTAQDHLLMKIERVLWSLLSRERSV
jgi:hypothetical protein